MTSESRDALAARPVCAVCGAGARSHCGKCGNAHYCGRECQIGAWPAHKWLCSPSVRVARRPAGGADDGRGARLVALKAFKEGDEVTRERPLARIAHENAISASSKEAAVRYGEKLWASRVAAMAPGPERDLILDLSDA